MAVLPKGVTMQQKHAETSVLTLVGCCTAAACCSLTLWGIITSSCRREHILNSLEATLTNKQDRQPDSKAGKRPEKAVQMLPSSPWPCQSTGKREYPGCSVGQAGNWTIPARTHTAGRDEDLGKRVGHVQKGGDSDRSVKIWIETTLSVSIKVMCNLDKCLVEWWRQKANRVDWEGVSEEVESKKFCC